MFSARYGNIYSSRQLIQLIDRVDGKLRPIEDVWEKNGRFIDPFRPQLTPGGYWSREELRADRFQHFEAVKNLLKNVDVFIFTLGLTETWARKEDGVVYPVCPGVAGGEFDPDLHVFVNLTYEDVLHDLRYFVKNLSQRNRNAKIILTVSPVALVATATTKHVLSATTYSKSVLRVAAETMSREFDHVDYFPSFEIITGTFNKGAY